MLNRVSTVQLPEYFTDAYKTTFGPSGPFSADSVFLGKKGEGQFHPVERSFFTWTQVYYPKLDGWVEYDQYMNRVYPNYTFPENQPKLPEWVVFENYPQGESYGREFAPRYIIGEDPLIGPFTFTEAVKIYSVVKKIKAKKTSLSSVSVSALGLNVSAPLVFDDGFYTQSVAPYLFSPEYKDYQYNYGNLSTPDGGTWHYDENDRGDEGFENLYLRDCYVYEGSSYITNPSLPSYQNRFLSGMPIIMDVDNYSEFYFDANLFFSYYFQLTGDFTMLRFPDDPDSDDPEDTIFDLTGNDFSLREVYHLGKFKYLRQEGTTTTTNDGPSAEIKIKFSLFTKNVKLKIGSITKDFVMNGFREEVHAKTISDYNTPPDVSFGAINLTPLEFEVDEFWPYKNANGQPVYNTTTGAIINSPIP